MEDNVDRTKDVQIIVDAQHHGIVIDCKDEETTLSITKKVCNAIFYDNTKYAHWQKIPVNYKGDKPQKGYIRCSNCGADFTLPFDDFRGFYQRYCGCCGCKMLEERERENG